MKVIWSLVTIIILILLIWEWILIFLVAIVIVGLIALITKSNNSSDKGQRSSSSTSNNFISADYMRNSRQEIYVKDTPLLKPSQSKVSLSESCKTDNTSTSIKSEIITLQLENKLQHQFYLLNSLTKELRIFNKDTLCIKALNRINKYQVSINNSTWSKDDLFEHIIGIVNNIIKNSKHYKGNNSTIKECQIINFLITQLQIETSNSEIIIRLLNEEYKSEINDKMKVSLSGSCKIDDTSTSVKSEVITSQVENKLEYQFYLLNCFTKQFHDSDLNQLYANVLPRIERWKSSFYESTWAKDDLFAHIACIANNTIKISRHSKDKNSTIKECQIISFIIKQLKAKIDNKEIITRLLRGEYEYIISDVVDVLNITTEPKLCNSLIVERNISNKELSTQNKKHTALLSQKYNQIEEVVKLINKGMECEKHGNFLSAVNNYKDASIKAENCSWLNFHKAQKQLADLYKNHSDKDNELRIIKDTIDKLNTANHPLKYWYERLDLFKKIHNYDLSTIRPNDLLIIENISLDSDPSIPISNIIQSLLIYKQKQEVFQRIANMVTATSYAYLLMYKQLKGIFSLTKEAKIHSDDIILELEQLGIDRLSATDIYEVLKLCCKSETIIHKSEIQKYMDKELDPDYSFFEVSFFIVELYYDLISNNETKDNLDEDSIVDVSDFHTIIQYDKEIAIRNEKKTKRVQIDFLKNRQWTLIDRNSDIKLHNLSISYWEHEYIYGKDSIISKSDEIKESYLKIRNDFFNGIYYNLDPQTNYAFILFFDITDSYKYHYNFTHIENQLYILGKCCNQVNHYSVRELLKIARKYDIDNNRTIEDPLDIKSLYAYYSDSREWNYKEICEINYGIKGDDTVFFEFRDRLGWHLGCYGNQKLDHIICHLYLGAVKELIMVASTNKTGFDKELLKLKKHHNFTLYNENASSVLTMYFAMYTICVNCLFENWGVSVKKNNYYTENTILSEEFYDSKIISNLTTIVKRKVSEIGIIPRDIELYINKVLCPTHWKEKYSSIVDKYNQNNDINEYSTQIADLIDRNHGNSNIKHLHWESMRLLYKTHKTITLDSYLKYIQVNASDSCGIEKPIPKYITKKIFSTPEQQEDFNKILHLFKNDYNRETANIAVEQLYLPKRKKLNINYELIDKAEHRYSKTVELLSKVLEDDKLAEELTEKLPELSEAMNSSQTKISNVSSELFNDVQNMLLNLFVENNYMLSQNQVFEYSKSKGAMANQLISAINENAYDTLDDNLIEVNDNKYQLIEEYYKML